MSRMSRITSTTSRLQSWNADLEAERCRSLADAVISIPDRGADGIASTSRQTRTEEIEGHSHGSASPGERVTAFRVVCECHLDTLHARGQLTRHEWEDGTWFRRTYQTGYRNANVTAGYNPNRGGGDNSEEAARVTFARHDLAALAKMPEMISIMWATLESVAGHDNRLGVGNLRYIKAALALVRLYRDATRAPK